jgi:serine/threonine protein kinase
MPIDPAPLQRLFIPDSEYPGTLGWLEDFLILGELGRGSFGVVYQVRRRGSLNRLAMKVLMQLDDDSLRRFRQECELLRKHQFVCCPKCEEDLFQINGKYPAFLMEYLNGRTLDRWEPADANLITELMAFEFVSSLAQGIKLLHERDVFHRDLDPKNVMLLPDGTIRLLDLGLVIQCDLPSQSLALNQVRGTLRSMDPKDYVERRPLTEKSDLYSMSCVIWRYFTGHFLVDGCPRMEDIAGNHQKFREYLNSKGWFYDFQEAILKLIDPDEAQRWSTIDRFLDALDPVARTLRAGSTSSVVSALPRRNRPDPFDVPWPDRDNDNVRILIQDLLGKNEPDEPTPTELILAGTAIIKAGAIVLNAIEKALGLLSTFHSDFSNNWNTDDELVDCKRMPDVVNRHFAAASGFAQNSCLKSDAELEDCAKNVTRTLGAFSRKIQPILKNRPTEDDVIIKLIDEGTTLILDTMACLRGESEALEGFLTLRKTWLMTSIGPMEG